MNDVPVVIVPARLIVPSVSRCDCPLEPFDVDDVPGLARSGFPPSRASPSACKAMNDERAVVNDSASAFAVPGRLLRMLVSDRVRGSTGVCHPLPPCLAVSAVGLASGVLKGLACEALFRRAAERMDALRPRLPPEVECEERFERVLRSLRFDPVRSEERVGEMRPGELGLDLRGT